MHNQGLGFWIDKRRRRSPENVAMIHGDGETLTYRELADVTDRVSAALDRLGIGKGDRVAYIGENSPQFLQVLFGAAQLGAVFVPVNTRLAAPEIAHVLRDSAARLVIYDPALADRVTESLDVDTAAQAIENGDGTDAAPGLSRLMRETSSAHVDVEVGLEEMAMILYTSGTTGRSKGAVLTHRNLTWMAINVLVDYDVVSSDVALMISPLFHAASLGMGALPMLLKGATLVLERGFEAGRALELIERHGVTMLSGVPTTFQLLADHANWAKTDLSTLQKLTCGGSAVPSRIQNAFEARGLAFSGGYGMTEASPGATSLSATMTRAKQGSVGLAHFFTDVRVADQHGATLPPEAIGEIQITGPNVFAGYLNLPAATAEAFTDDGWFRSGDVGHVDADGYLFITDRLKDMIISGGENIYPAELENLLHDLDGISGAAVIGVPDEQWGEVAWAIITVREGVDIDTGTVRAHLSGMVARYKLPKHVVIVDELPRTASGKVRKADLRARFGP